MNRWFSDIDPPPSNIELPLIPGEPGVGPPDGDWMRSKSEATGSDYADAGDPVDEAQHLIPSFTDMHGFLTTTLPWRWLLGRLKVRSNRPRWPDHIADAILDWAASSPSRSHRSAKSERRHVEFRVEWNAVRFLRQHYPDANDGLLENTVTLSGHGDFLQATACVDYLTTNWEIVSDRLLSALQSDISKCLGIDECLPHSTARNTQELDNMGFSLLSDQLTLV